MIPYVVAAIAGAFFVNRNAPKTKLQKMKVLGTRTGNTYDVDLVPNLGVVIIHAQDGSSAVFQKNPPPRQGFTFLRGTGNPQLVAAMKQDLEG